MKTALFSLSLLTAFPILLVFIIDRMDLYSSLDGEVRNVPRNDSAMTADFESPSRSWKYGNVRHENRQRLSN